MRTTHNWLFSSVFLCLCAMIALTACLDTPPPADDDDVGGGDDDDVVGDDDDGADDDVGDDDDAADAVGIYVDYYVNATDDLPDPLVCCIDWDLAQFMDGNLVSIPDDGDRHNLRFVRSDDMCDYWDPGEYWSADTWVEVVDGRVEASVYHYQGYVDGPENGGYLDAFPELRGDGYEWMDDGESSTIFWINVSEVEAGGTFTVSLNADLAGEWYCDMTPGLDIADDIAMDFGEMAVGHDALEDLYINGHEVRGVSALHGFVSGDTLTSDIDSWQFVCNRL